MAERSGGSSTAGASGRASVDAWYEALGSHPDRTVLLALCAVLESVDERASCEIKWNAPSYRITEHFATTGMAPKGGVRLVLHTGAAKREDPLDLRDRVDDPAGLLRWQGPDRAVAVFTSTEQVAAAQESLASVVRTWIALTQ